MTHGRQVCNTLKEIRRQIADKNEIEYTTSECHFEGECEGTCPKCESELQYLENELHRRTQLGKAVAVAGISLGMAGTFAGCNTPKQNDTPISTEQKIVTEIVDLDTNSAIQQEEPVLQMIGSVPEIVELESEGYDISEGIIIEIKDIIEESPLPLSGIIGTNDAADLLEHHKIAEAGEYKIYEPTEVIDILPEFIGGDEELNKFLVDNLEYSNLKGADVVGRVILRFIVEKDGSLTNIEVVKSPHKLLSDEAIRVVKLMSKWKPAQKDGKNVRAYFTLPIDFKLD